MKQKTFKWSAAFVKLSSCAGVAGLWWGALSSARADYPTTVLSLNPIVYYRLNETVQPPAADIATNSGSAGARGNAYYYDKAAIDPTLNATHGQSGALAGSTDTAVTFNGTDNYIMMALPDETNSLNPQGPFSAELWLNPSLTGTGCAFSFADVNGLGGNADGWLIYEAVTNWNLTMFNGNGGNAAVSIAGGTVVAGVWQHVVAVYDGAFAYLYVNGQQVAQASAAGFVPNKSGQLTIGARSDEGFFFNGSADEVALYTNILSAADVLAHYENGTNASRGTPYDALVQTRNPLLYYRLDEPMYNVPDPSSLPVATNLSTVFGTNANGIYISGTTPGAAGPPFSGLGPTPLACKFNGASGCVQLGDIVSLLGGSIPSTLTVSAWVKLDDLEQNRGFDMIVGADDDSFRLQRGNTGDHGTLQWACSGEHYDHYEGLVPLDDGQWHHLVATVSPDGMSNYVDGALDFYRPQIPSQSTLNTSATLTSVGECIKNPGRVWNGSISEVAIFSNVLTTVQVQQLYAASQAAPEITQQPAVTPPVYEGSTLALSVTAAGVPPLSYQWTINSFALSGQTTSSLVFTNVTSAINGSYALIVTNAYGMVTSSVVPITVMYAPPIIVQQPAPITRWVGGSPTLFSVVAVGSEPLSYQWLFSTNPSPGTFVPIPGATSATLTLPGPLQASDAGYYSVMITNIVGIQYNQYNGLPNVPLRVLTPPNNYAAQVMALGPYTYWPLNETNGSTAYDYSSGINGTNIGSITPGAAGNPAPGFGSVHPVYNFNHTGAVDCGNGVNMNDTTFTLLAWVFDNNSGLNQCGIITKGNNSWRTAIFNTHYLEYTANGLYPLADGTTYTLTGPGGGYTPPVTNILDDGQWHFMAAVYDCPYSHGDKRLYFDGVLVQETNVLGSFAQNTDEVWIGNNIGNDNGDNYWPGMLSDIAIFNRALSTAEVASLYAAATNSSTPALGIAGQPVSQVAFAGHPATLTVGATGLQPFSYQWRQAGIPIPGATRQSYTIPSVNPSDAGSYDVVVTDSTGSTNSNPASLTVVYSTNAPTGLAVGLVAHYQFDGDFTDCSGNNHNAMPVGSPTFVSGRIGTAIHVDTTGTSLDDCVVLDNPTNIDNNADFQFNQGDMFSFAFWVNYSGTPGDLPMIGNVYNSTDNQGIVLADSFFDDGGGNLQLSIEAWPGAAFIEGDFTADGATLLNDGGWHHIAAAVDLFNNMAHIYIDGVLVQAHPIPAVGNLDYSDGFILGSDPTLAYEGNSPGGYSIDDMGIWRRLLTAGEVANIYSLGLSGQPFAAAVPAPGLAVPLTISLIGPNVQLSWPQGTLQSAPTVTGPWSAVTGASPPSFSTSHSGAPTFYRVHP